MKKIALVLGLSLLCLAQAHAADTRKGAATYDKYCASCHGPSGVPEMAGAPNFAMGERLMRPDNDVLQGVREGKNAMPAFQGLLTNDEILNVVAYLRTLSF